MGSQPAVSDSAIRIPLAGPLAIFLLGGVLGQLASYDPRLGVRWLIWLVAGVALYVAVVTLSSSPRALLRCAALPVGAAVLAALLLALQYRHLAFDAKFGPIAMIGNLTSALFPVLVTTHVDANAAAATLEGTLPLAICIAAAHRGRQRLNWALCALLIAFGILLTASRGSWVALAAAGLLGGLALLRRPERARLAQGWLIGLGVFFVLAVVFLLTPPGQGVLAAVSYRAADRLTLYRNSFFMALDVPFSGIGPGGTFGMTYSHNQLLILVPYVGYAHNLLLGIWLSQGLLGLLGFSAMFLSAFRLIWRAMGRTSGPLLWWVGLGASLGCVTILLHGLTDAPQYDTSWPAMLMSFLLLGVAVAAAMLADDRPLVWIRLGRVPSLAAASLALILLVLCGRILLAAASVNVAAVLAIQSDLQPGRSAVGRADLRSGALRWAEQGASFHGTSPFVMKQRGMLLLGAQDFTAAGTYLRSARAGLPADQALRKALGYAYIWGGQEQAGIALLASLDRAAEVRQELSAWPFAWNDVGRPDLAARAQRAATLMPPR